MTVTTNNRFGVKDYGAGSDAWLSRAGWKSEIINKIVADAAIYTTGVQSARPAAGTEGRIYWATDTKRLWWDDGSAWTEVSPVGGGGTPAAGTAAGAEGTSRIAARADHAHPEPGWTAMTLAANWTQYGGGTPAYRIVGRVLQCAGAARWTGGGTIPTSATMLATGLPAPAPYSTRSPMILTALGFNNGSGTDPIGMGMLNPRDDGGLRVYRISAGTADVVNLESIGWRTT